MATLDLLSKGRIEFRMGEGDTWTEVKPFDFDFEDKRKRWGDAVRCITPVFNDDRCVYNGPFLQVPVAQRRSQAIA